MIMSELEARGPEEHEKKPGRPSTTGVRSGTFPLNNEWEAHR
jgi:hypothetical protein